MKKKRSTRAERGDVFEIPLSQGFAYAQYVLNCPGPPEYGPLIRVFDHVFENSQSDVAAIAKLPERVLVFFPVSSAINQGVVRILGPASVPDRFCSLPLFKAAGAGDQTSGAVRIWWLWNGVREWSEVPLQCQHFDLPHRQIVNGVALIKLIESGWHPRDEVFRGRPDLLEKYERWRHEQEAP